MQVIGLCRFSYPAYGGFQIEHDTIEERRRYLYNPARLEERFRLFEATTLPCFKEQTDEDFQFLIVIGECLPKPAFDRLHDLTAGMKQVKIIARKPMRHRRVMKEILNAARDNPDSPCLQFRHDDDDAVSVDFVERLRIAAIEGEGLMANNRTVAIDYNQGFLARFDAEGIQAAQVFRPLLGVGFAMHVLGRCEQTIMNFAHHRIGNFMPVVSYPDAPMWVRTLNQFNDSPHARNSTAELSPLTPELEGEFIARFAIEQDVVRRVHSAT
ncbi:putative rhamnosyl transferase [Ruegeria lacuscaerulensis]|uniref:putative rhamnosyl transferase n=1 Tax=Ruegeria lacuscaerulensis TaxID=55218 RepID=UPI00147AD7E1|nr:putative rhamnosyl transferase [Ruegeria lacuscaerulensis]